MSAFHPLQTLGECRLSTRLANAAAASPTAGCLSPPGQLTFQTPDSRLSGDQPADLFSQAISAARSLESCMPVKVMVVPGAKASGSAMKRSRSSGVQRGCCCAKRLRAGE